MTDPRTAGRFSRLPRALGVQAKWVLLGDDVPALVAHPDWSTPAPAVIWMHGRTVHKELDPGRYLRWLRAGIATVALDLPGHGERLDPAHHKPHKTLDTLTQMVGEIDGVIADLPGLGPFDMDRLGIGGMSAGGMATLIRLCRAHPFVCAAVEGTTGNLGDLYFGDGQREWMVHHDPAGVAALDPMEHMAGFRSIPLLALHNEGDAFIPIGGQRRFVTALKNHYKASGNNPDSITLHTFENSGAPAEHAGFGRFSNEAKNLQTAFLAECFGLGDVKEQTDSAVREKR